MSKGAYAKGTLPGARELFRGDGMIYLSGPMTGIPESNYPAFNAEAVRLRTLGYEVFNPAEITAPDDPTWENYMRECIRGLTECDTVAVLPAAENSRGAQLEMTLAYALGMPIVRAESIHQKR